ncbi:hypothetical protein SAMN02745866_03714 [Alteromonadaceae bacterium Bs31]|nr:hypothetical protein SAMN02745866_03714 [Alteromonadaceae bacterium Bs31]
MLLVKNKTPLVHAVLPYTDHCDQNFVSVIVKGSFDITADGTLKLADKQEPLRETDQYTEQPGNASLLRESDYCPIKTATDVFVLGDIVSPNEKPCLQFDACMEIGQHHRVIRASGDRYWQKEGLRYQASQPQAFSRMPLILQNAYGGSATENEEAAPESYAYNPVGKGFISKNTNIEGVALPNLESPERLISTPEQKPLPYCPAFLNKNWLPRSQLAGNCDEQWQAQRMPLLPKDFDIRFYNAALPEFILPMLKGGEPVNMQGFSPEGALSFTLPNWNMKIKYCMKNEVLEARSKLDTLTILSNKRQVIINWRACFPCAQNFLYIKWMEIKAVYV